MDDENPCTGVGKMNFCNYFSNIASLTGLGGWFELTASDYTLWLNSKKIREEILLNLIWFLKLVHSIYIVTEFTFYRWPLKVMNLKYFCRDKQYIMYINFLPRD